jgi:hypothetical protein
LPAETPATPAPAPTPAETARVATSGLRVEGQDMSSGVIQVTATPLAGTADAPGNPTGASVRLAGLPPSAILAPGLYRVVAEVPTPVLSQPREGDVVANVRRTTRIAYTTVEAGRVRVVQQTELLTASDAQQCRAYCQQGRADYAAAVPGCACTAEEAPPAPPAQGTSVVENVRTLQAGMLGDLSNITVKGAAKALGVLTVLGLAAKAGEKWLWGRRG